MELRIREVDKGGGGLTETQASEAKGPFPGGKRVGSRGKKKKEKEKGEGRAPADLHPPINKNGGLEGYLWVGLRAIREKNEPPLFSEGDKSGG